MSYWLCEFDVCCVAEWAAATVVPKLGETIALCIYTIQLQMLVTYMQIKMYTVIAM